MVCSTLLVAGGCATTEEGQGDDDDVTVIGDDDSTASDDDDVYGDDDTAQETDGDGDGWSIEDGDCNDGDVSIHPGADEFPCDAIDSDCDGVGQIVAAAAVNGNEMGSISNAVAAAVDGDTVYICPGIHTEQIVIQPGIQLEITSWSGTPTDTILDGEGVRTILFIDREASLTVSSLQFVNGEAQPWLDGDHAGGAIMSLGGTVVVVDGCVFEDNNSIDYGAAIEIYSLDEQNVSVSVTDCQFYSNIAGQNGAAIAIGGWGSSSVFIRQSWFESNQAGYSGGAIYSSTWEDVRLTIEDTTCAQNNADYNGGCVGISNHEQVDLQLINVVFESNNAANSGAAVDVHVLHSDDLVADILDCSFELNSAGYAGGAVQVVADGELHLNIESSVFMHNSAEHSAAAVVLGSGVTDLFADITDCMFDGNQASVFGGTIEIGAGYSEVYISETTIEDNTGPYGAAVYFGGPAVAEHYCVMDEVTIVDNGGDEAVVWVDKAGQVDFVGGEVRRNTGGGLFITDWNSVVTSSGVNWGTGADDNTPYDVDTESGGQYSDFGVGATFSCTGAGGCT